MGPSKGNRHGLGRLPTALAELLAVSPDEVRVRSDGDANLVLDALGQTFVLQWSRSAAAGRVAAVAEHAASSARRVSRRTVPLVAVPYMSSAGRHACEAANVPWFDLSGNARIIAPGLRVIIDGRPNQFRRPGRPASLFAPKSARVVRWLLMHPRQAFTQREIARSTQMTEGFVSRIVGRLEADRYVERVDASGAGDGFGNGYGAGAGAGAGDGFRNEYGAGAGAGSGGGHTGRAPIRVRDPALLLDAWRDAYDFAKHTIVQGHVAARSGDALSQSVSDTLATEQVEHAATGLAAAWQLTHFAGFRLATFFVAEHPVPELMRKLGFREDPRGANLWLVVPNDSGVFHGAAEQDGLRCVHPVQTYVDLKAHPERAREAAEHLCSELLWRHDG